MGFDDARIVLDRSNNAYYTEQTIRGRLIFDQQKVKTFRGIYVKFVGFCKVHWTTTETRRVDDKDETYTVEHESYEEYCRVKKFLVGGESGDHHLQPGHYDYPFTFDVPGNCPSSYEGEYAHIRYEIKVVVDKAFKIDQRKVIGIRVMAPLNLNHNPYCKEPLEIEISDTYCCCCFSSGSSETVVNAPLCGYCPGQKITLEVTSANRGSVEIDEIKLRIKKKLVFTAERVPDTREENSVLGEITKGPIPGNTTRNWSIEMVIPAVDAYNFTGCSYISLTYEFEVFVSPEGCHSDSEKSQHIIIGTIPLVGYQDDVANPLHDQMPQQVSAITQQPSFSVATSPYLNHQNPPYPVTPPQMNSNPPYRTNDSLKSHGTNSTSYPPSYQPFSANDALKFPYHSANPPYPATNAPYTATNAPYPSANSPYPSSNPPDSADSSGFIKPPYPVNDAATSPYPPGNSPYVGGAPNIAINPPYSTNDTSKSPYPPASSPKPSASVNQPYPSANSPYPSANPPYSADSSHFIKPPYPVNDAATSPYPPGNSPYVGGAPSIAINPPYSTNDTSKSIYPPASSPKPSASVNPPYPSVSSPYPSENPPYPADSPGFIKPPYPVNDTATSPYPSENSPYVGGAPTIAINPPYSTNDTSKSPCPPARFPKPSASVNPYPNVTPFHNNPPPYPGNSSPFPAQKSPNQMGSMPTLGTRTLLKTGNVGFIVQGATNMSSTPYPTAATPLLASPAPTNPYPAASAPALDSPEIEKE